MAAGVYKITNLINGKFYIGSSGNIAQRFSAHKSALRKGKHGNTYLQASWNKHGEEAFAFEVLEECSEEASVLEVLEQRYMDELQAYKRKNGYNLRINAFTNRGYRFSEQTRRRMSAAKTGIKHSPEAIAKRVAKAMGHKWNLGRKITPEQRADVRARMAARKKPVLQLSLTKHIVAEYASKGDAAEATGINATNIARACQEGRRAGGYYWVFKNEQKAELKAITRPGKYYQVEQRTLNGEVVAVWNNLKHAATKTGIGSSGISHCCNGRKKQSNGFQWRYLKPEVCPSA